MKEKLLRIKDLQTFFFTESGVVKAVDQVDLELGEGDTLGLVGESGCGKSVTALSIMRLIDPPGKITAGEILFKDQDLLKLKESDMEKVRGNQISMIFQEPMTSLNPVFSIGTQIAETIRTHQDLSKKESMDQAVQLLDLVKIPSPRQRSRDYPHQLSGGMRQRVMIAIALCCHPSILIADEPTTALDVTIQAQIMDLIEQLKEKTGASVILITHDLGVIAETAQFMAVMYAGKIMEYTDVRRLFGEPMHPYTSGLMRCIPRMDREADGRIHLEIIPGLVPNLLELGSGCKFRDRCDQRLGRCKEEEPPIVESAPGHWVRCWRARS
jgi:oligopeptide/dipeptide ABC transporter ATP-binding protein